MTMTESHRRAKAKVAEIDADLLSTDPRLRGAVQVEHRDGSSLFFRNAFAYIWTDGEHEWVLVLTEHLGAHVFLLEDLERTATFVLESSPPRL